MPYTMTDFLKEVALEHLHELTPEERMHGLTVKQLEDYLRRRRQEAKYKGAKKRKPKR